MRINVDNDENRYVLYSRGDDTKTERAEKIEIWSGEGDKG